MGTDLGAADEVNAILDQPLSGKVRGMRLTGQDELHGLPWVGLQPDQSVRILNQ